MLELDHIAVLGETLAEAVAHVERTLGQPMAPGGQHPRFATHNQLLGLASGLYLEAIAIDPAATPPSDPRWFGLDGFRGAARLDKWICRVEDLDAAIARFPMAGRRVELARGDLRWAMAVPVDGALPYDGLFPALIEWQVEVPPGKALQRPDLALRELVVSHPDAPALEALIGPFVKMPGLRFEIGPACLAARIDHDGQSAWLR